MLFIKLLNICSIRMIILKFVNYILIKKLIFVLIVRNVGDLVVVILYFCFICMCIYVWESGLEKRRELVNVLIYFDKVVIWFEEWVKC